MSEYKHSGFMDVDKSEEIPKTELNSQGEWYYDDDKIADLYLLIENKTIAKDKAKDLLSEVKAQYHNLDSRTDITQEEKENLQMLNKVANELTKYVGFDSDHDNPKPETPQEISGVH